MQAVTLRVRKAPGFFDAVKGLIGMKNPMSLYFETRWGIHTFGLRFPIDVIVLDNKNVVVITKDSLHSNQIFIWNPKYKKVIELPAGTIGKHHITQGTLIAVQWAEFHND